LKDGRILLSKVDVGNTLINLDDPMQALKFKKNAVVRIFIAELYETHAMF